jgi:hypothetical protein
MNEARCSSAGPGVALFAHLFASDRTRERRVFWLAGLLLNVPAVLLFFQQAMPARELPRAEWPRASITEADHFLMPVDASWTEPARATAGVGTTLNHAQADHSPQPVTNMQLAEIRAGSSPAIANDTRAASLLERLNPGRASSDLISPARPHAPTRIEEASARLATRLNVYNDSVLVERAAAKRAEDWTKVDASGRRWGITPGTVHASGVRLRLALTVGDSIADVLQPPPGRREEAKARAQLWNEIQLQVRRAEVAAVFSDRVKQIRDRNNNERKPGGSRQ